ncbi:hypothetical protein ALC53_14277 [Atta colombica]|uniref:Uncharacterized protein n=1 Tax=Atta colombica TaxID=520822 RepID=A0A151HXT2_9HYME|nr:hypothetical protein ALC53_14277 [Atta colombica]
MPLIKSFLTPDLNSKLTELPRKNTAPNYRERRANERPEDGGAAPEGLRGKILGDLRIPTREVARLLVRCGGDRGNLATPLGRSSEGMALDTKRRCGLLIAAEAG